MQRAHARAVVRCLLVGGTMAIAVGGSACASVPDASATSAAPTPVAPMAPVETSTTTSAAVAMPSTAAAVSTSPLVDAPAATDAPQPTDGEPANAMDDNASVPPAASAQTQPATGDVVADPATVEATPAAGTPAAAPRTATPTPATPRSAAAPMPAPTSTAGSVAGSLFALLLVLGLILGMAWLAKRLPGAARGGAANSALRVVASVPLGQRERAVVVDVGGTQLLLGVGPGGTRTLHTLAQPLPQADAPPAFAQLLSQHFGKKP